MFHYLGHLLFSADPEEEVEMEDYEKKESDSDEDQAASEDEEVTSDDDDGNVYYADSESESEEVCCGTMLSKLVLCCPDKNALKLFWQANHKELQEKGITVVPKYEKACSPKDGIPCECNKSVQEEEKPAVDKLSTSL